MKIKPSWIIIMSGQPIPISPIVGKIALEAGLIKKLEGSEYPHTYVFVKI